MTELKNCALCDGWSKAVGNVGCGYRCHCTSCGCSGPIKVTEEEAIKAWNRRAAPDLSGLSAAADEEFDALNNIGRGWVAVAGKANLRNFVANAVEEWLRR